MSAAGRPARPIIIRRVTVEAKHGHHGGGWKVAYADFVTAMMAFFLLLWLVGSADEETLKGLAEFFSDARINTGPPGGAGGILEGFSPTPEPLAAPFAAALTPAVAPFPVNGGEAMPTGIDTGEEISLAGDGAEVEGDGFADAMDTLAGALEAEPELAALIPASG